MAGDPSRLSPLGVRIVRILESGARLSQPQIEERLPAELLAAMDDPWPEIRTELLRLVGREIVSVSVDANEMVFCISESRRGP